MAKGCVKEQTRWREHTVMACVGEVERTAHSAIVPADCGCMRYVCWSVNMCWEEQA